MGRRGFTFIELLATMTLVAGMILAVTNVLTLISRRQSEIERRIPENEWHNHLARQLRWDLENARKWELTEHHLKLTGFAGIDVKRRQANFDVCEVTYRIQQIGDKRWLVRVAEYPQRKDNSKPQVNLMCHDVRAIEVRVASAAERVKQTSGDLPPTFQLHVLCGPADSKVIVRCIR